VALIVAVNPHADGQGFVFKPYSLALVAKFHKGKYDHEGADDIIYCEGIISNGTMSGADIAMWNKIKSLMDYEDKVLVLSMNGDIDNINDKREIRVLKEILEKASQNNDVFVVIKGEGENTVIENKVRYVSYDDSFEIGISGGKISYKN
jgi:hypothetical protein